ncbi:MAG: DUF433 domain-containing protein [Nostoc sp. DedQUE05]|nr:DUF433 domain-containing protein [Nostoc sp. DedQUE05]MDZ8094564.1 DUF433 domain-containing protein [Nostoc sp. DedQUE05]
MNYHDIITIEPGKCSEKPCMRGMRITVYDILEYSNPKSFVKIIYLFLLSSLCVLGGSFPYLYFSRLI